MSLAEDSCVLTAPFVFSLLQYVVLVEGLAKLWPHIDM